jgi:predicted Zn-dependent protease
MENIPSHINYFDNEFREFTKTHPNTRLTRNFVVEQKVIVNSKGGKAIQSTPFFEIYYSQGYQPITTNRSLGVICKSKEDIINLPKLIKYLPDPYPDKKIKKSKTFSEAFHNLFQISKLTHDSFEDAKIELKSLYDVIMLSGVPIHEIFGHHFEEPIGYLNFNDSMTFNIDQKIENKSIILEDNPKQEIEGYNVLGYTNFDAYGRKRETKTHIKDGKIHEFLGSEYGDLVKLNEIFNDKSFFGNATQDTVGTFPQPRMSCTVLKGETKPIDLEGKIVSVSHEGETNQRSKYYQATAYETYIIRNSIPERIVPIQVSGGINQALENITLLGDEIYQIGSCMKSDPIFQSNSSSVPVSQFVKSQLWKKQQVYPIKIKK